MRKAGRVFRSYSAQWAKPRHSDSSKERPACAFSLDKTGDQNYHSSFTDFRTRSIRLMRWTPQLLTLTVCLGLFPIRSLAQDAPNKENFPRCCYPIISEVNSKVGFIDETG